MRGSTDDWDESSAAAATLAQLMQVIAESEVIDLEPDEWRQVEEHMESDLLTFAPRIVTLLLNAKRRGPLLHLTALLGPKTRQLASDTRYVKSLQALYAKEPISRIADALTRVTG